MVIISGGIVGVAGAAALGGSRKYKPASIVIQSYLNFSQQEELIRHLCNAIIPYNINTCINRLTDIIYQNPHLRNSILNTLKWYFECCLHTKVKFYL
jgi:hypothetical protein